MLGQGATKTRREWHVSESVQQSLPRENLPCGSIPCRRRKLSQTEIHLLAKILKISNLIATQNFIRTKLRTRDVGLIAPFGADSFHSGIKIVYRHFQFFIFTLFNIQNGL